MRRLRLAIATVLAGLAFRSSPGAAQGVEGPGTGVTVDQLLGMPEVYDSKVVRTSGELEVIPARRGHQYAFRGTNGLRLLLVPQPSIAEDWADQAPQWVGREVVVSGRFQQAPPGTAPDGAPVLNDPGTGGAPLYLVFWKFEGPAAEERPGPRRKAPGEVSLQDLASNLESFIGREMIVTGQFRGHNLFGDLPAHSRTSAEDWVLKDADTAVWVTGKKAEGKGWKLDPSSRSDSAKWLQVKGRVKRSGDVVVIRAASVALINRPSTEPAAAP